MTFDLTSIIDAEIHDNPAQEIKNIQGTFEACMKKNGEDSFSPMLILFDHESSPLFVIESRPFGDKPDMYSCFAEMLYSFSALKAQSFVFAVDTKLTKVDSNDLLGEKIDALFLTFATNDAACVVILPYKINSTNDVIWNENEFNISSLNEETKNSSGTLSDLYYVMSHMKDSPFSFNTLVNYYSFRDFPFHTSDALVSEKIMIKV